MKYLFLLLFVPFTLFSQQTIYYGNTPYRFSSLSLLTKNTFPPNSYNAEVCYSRPFIFFMEKVGTYKYTATSETDYKYNVTESFTNGFSKGFPDKSTIEISTEDGSHIVTIITKGVSTYHFKKSGMSAVQKNIFSNPGTITLCDINPTDSIEFNVTLDDSPNALFTKGRLNSALEVFKNNGFEKDLKFGINELNEGDSLHVIIDPYGIQTPNKCYIGEGSLNISTTKYSISYGGSVKKYNFEKDQNYICPGDTLIIKPLSDITYTKWFTSISTPIIKSTDVNYSITSPQLVSAQYYPNVRTCPYITDTISFLEAKSCPLRYVKGTVYYDLDSNFSYSYNDAIFESALLKINENKIISSDHNGEFITLVPNAARSRIFIFNSKNFRSDTVFIDLRDTAANKIWINEVRIGNFIANWGQFNVDITSSRFRPGFQAEYNIKIENQGNEDRNANLEIKVDTLLKNLKFSIDPIQSSFNKYTFALGRIQRFQPGTLKIIGNIDPEVEFIGSELITTAQVFPLGESERINHFDTNRTIVTGSYDPNDKSAFPNRGFNSVMIMDTSIIEYMIRFQNKGTDTAFSVVVVDTIEAGLDISTYEAISSSHTNSLSIHNNNILKWTFKDILLPDDKVNEPGSHGYIKFKIGQTNNNAPGSTISNKALIYFDYNPAIVTNTEIIKIGENLVVTSLDKSNSENNFLSLFPNPARNSVTIIGSQSGQIIIYNSWGQKIMEKDFKGNEVINTEDLKNGIHYVTLVSENKVLTEKLFICR